MSTPVLQPLFKRTSTGKIQYWHIEIDEDRYRTVSGQLGGKLVTSEYTVAEPKNVGRANETTPEEQAILEAKSAWQKKLDSGYKTSTGEVDDETFIKPMLAKTYDEYGDRVEFPCFVQPKLDGMRAIVTRKGMTSRNGKPIVSAPHIHEGLLPIFDAHPEIVAFDGELYANKYKDDFNKIISLAKKAKPTRLDLEESMFHLQYWVYDVITKDPLTFAQRTALLSKVFTAQILAMDPQFYVLVETHEVHTSAQADELYEKWMNEGYEGQMVRWGSKPYENKRSDALLKRKEFVDDEFEIVDICEGVGNKSGMAGYAVLSLPGYRTFRANIMGGNSYAKRLLEEKHTVIGKKGTVKFFAYTPDGMPRFPHLKAIRDYE